MEYEFRMVVSYMHSSMSLQDICIVMVIDVIHRVVYRDSFRNVIRTSESIIGRCDDPCDEQTTSRTAVTSSSVANHPTTVVLVSILVQMLHVLN